MMIPTAQPAHINDDTRPWSWAAADSALPNGLPAGALTVIRIRRGGDPARDWRNTVADLVRTTLVNHRHVAYVPVDSDNHQQPISEVATRVGEGGRLGILVDEDHFVHVRDDRGRARAYGCGVPTMDRVQELVGGFEDDYGPSLVVLDGLEYARPYQATEQDLVTFPNEITINRRAVNEWRALEMGGYADCRPHAPTVVVWNDDASPAHADAIDVLGDVAVLIIEAYADPQGEAFLSISQRTRLDQPVPHQQYVRLK